MRSHSTPPSRDDGGVERRQCRGARQLALAAETTGALAATFMTILRLLARQTRLPGATDGITMARGTARAARPPEASSRTTLLTSPPPSKPPRHPNHPQRGKLAHHATRLVWGHVKCVF